MPSSDALLVLAIETSCDETAVALLRGRDELLASEIASQIDLHRAYGGVVPEAASRQHLVELPLLPATRARTRRASCWPTWTPSPPRRGRGWRAR